jgi:hypothetical protein
LLRTPVSTPYSQSKKLLDAGRELGVRSSISADFMGIEKRCKSMKILGGRGRNRTYNLSVKSRMLCQLSYASIHSGFAVRRRLLRTA